MKPYTVEVTWRVPEYTHLTVLADSPAQAIELALAKVANNPDAHERTLGLRMLRHRRRHRALGRRRSLSRPSRQHAAPAANPRTRSRDRH